MILFPQYELALKWAENNLPEKKYHQIYKSYKALLKWTLIIAICCIPIIIAFTMILVNAPFSTKAQINAMPYGATECIFARADYDGNFFWTSESKKYEYAFADYGLLPAEFRFGDKVKVYIDESNNVIEVNKIEDGLDIRELEVIIAIIGAFLVPIFIICCVYMPIAYNTFGKPWRNFIKSWR